MSALTNNRNLTLPQVGGDSGVWGNLLNDGVMSYLDNILGATLPITIDVANVTLTVDQWNNAVVKLTGTLTGNRNLILPFNSNSTTVAVGGLFVVDNQTTGAFNVTVITEASGSTGVTVPQGRRTFLYSDTTNVWYADNSMNFMAEVSGNPNGVLAGNAGAANSPPSVAWDYTNGILYFCTTTGSSTTAVWTAVSAGAVARGFDTVVNMSLAVTHTGGNLLSIALKTAAGADATTASPIIANFQSVSGSNTTGGVTSVSVTGALAMTTVGVGASLGSSNNTPFRFWIALFNNGGTPVLAIMNASTSAGIKTIAEQGIASTVAISAGSTSAGVWYSPGSPLTNKAYRLIGYCEYTTGLVTAGTYTSDPNNVVIFGPGIRKPGDVLQSFYSSTTTQTTISTTKTVTGLATSFSLSSPCNSVRLNAQGWLFGNNWPSGAAPWMQFYRNSGAVAVGATFHGGLGMGPSQGVCPVSVFGFDAPSSTNWPPTQYALYGTNSPSTAVSNLTFLGTPSSGDPSPNNGALMSIDEVMG